MRNQNGKGLITKEVAAETAREYLKAHPVAGIDGVADVVAHGEPGFRKPVFYSPERIDMDKCWIVHTKRAQTPDTLHFGGGHIIIVSKETGKILYSGTLRACNLTSKPPGKPGGFCSGRIKGGCVAH